MAGFGAYIRDARKLAGLTQEQLAERVSTPDATASATAVSNWENEMNPPSVEHFNRLVVALRLSAEELLQRMGYNVTPPAAAKLPQTLVRALLALDEEALRGVTILAERAAPGSRRA